MRHHALWLLIPLVVACSSEKVLTPSNLPADICDTPGTADLTVEAGTFHSLFPGVEDTCDARIPQEPPLLPICIRKFANVTLAGKLIVWPKNVAVAIVATDTFTLEAGGSIDATGPNDPRGGPPDSSWGSGDGAGHIGPGANGGPPGTEAPRGSAYGPTTGTQLVAGAKGGNAQPPMFGGGGEGGRGGGTLQIAACRDLVVAGLLTASGDDAYPGQNGYVQSTHSPRGTDGGGGGSGGTLLVEATRVITGEGGKLLAVGGHGGRGGNQLGESGEVLAEGGQGGAGGTGSSPPQQGQSWHRYGAGAGGGGGAVGRIVINLPEGVALPALSIDPPPAIGTVATH